jgi:hypothetical protein
VIDVVIATPGPYMINEYVSSLTSTIKELEKNNISWEYVYSYSPVISEARYKCVLEANKIQYKKMFWIDSDISWTPQDFMKIYLSTHEIISGTYLKATNWLSEDGLENYPTVTVGIVNKKEFLYREIANMKEPLEVFLTGLGFACISKDAINLLDNPFQQIVEIDENNNKVYHGEDSSWMLRMRKMGYKIWCDPTVRVSHHKNIKLSW